MAEGILGHPLRQLFWSSPFFAEWFGSTALMDWIETPTAHIFKIDVPGFSKDEIKVEVEDGNILQIRGKVDKEKVSEKETIWHLAERVAGNRNFRREIELPENVIVKKIKASVENGVLTINVLKEKEKKQSNVKNVKITSKL